MGERLKRRRRQYVLGDLAIVEVPDLARAPPRQLATRRRDEAPFVKLERDRGVAVAERFAQVLAHRLPAIGGGEVRDVAVVCPHERAGPQRLHVLRHEAVAEHGAAALTLAALL